MRHTRARPACGAEAPSARRRPAYPSSSQRLYRRRWMAGSSAAMTRAGQVAISLTVVVAAAVFAETALHHALAQTPFGAPRAAAPAQAGGMVAWLLARQAEF